MTNDERAEALRILVAEMESYLGSKWPPSNINGEAVHRWLVRLKGMLYE